MERRCFEFAMSEISTFMTFWLLSGTDRRGRFHVLRHGQGESSGAYWEIRADYLTHISLANQGFFSRECLEGSGSQLSCT